MIKKKIEKLLENELYKSISIIAKHPKMKKENRIIFEKLKNVFNDFNDDDYVFARQNDQDKDFLIKAFTCACGNFKHAQSDFCSRKCHFFKQSIVEKMKQTNLKKYGVENCSQLDEVKKVISEKKLNLSQEEKQAVLEKRKKTNLEKYGFECVTQAEEIKQKTKRTCLDRYGVTSFSKTEKFVNKMKQTSLEKFGVESYSQTDEYKQRYKQTCLEKYGVDNPAKTDEFKILAREIKSKPNVQYLTQENLLRYLQLVYPEVNDWIIDKPFSKEIKLRPDYRSDTLKIIVEFDGFQHYTNASNIIKDINRDKLFLEKGYKVIRVPYFIQACEYTLKVLFGRDVKLEQKFAHGFISKLSTCYLPASFCNLGLQIFYKNLEQFKEIKNEIIESLIEREKTQSILEIYPTEWIDLNRINDKDYSPGKEYMKRKNT